MYSIGTLFAVEAESTFWKIGSAGGVLSNVENAAGEIAREREGEGEKEKWGEREREKEGEWSMV